MPTATAVAARLSGRIAGAGEAVAGHNARSQIGMIVIHAGIYCCPANARAIIAQARQVAEVAGYRNTTRMITGYNLAGHFIFQFWLGAGVTEPEHGIELSHGRKRRSV